MKMNLYLEKKVRKNNNQMNLKDKRKIRNRNRIKHNSDRKRLSVFRSNNNIYAQIIDDKNGKTIASASSLEKEFVKMEKKTDFIVEKKVGKLVAERSIKQGIKRVVFDKGSYSYHGRVKALAESARSSGLDF